jgi:RNA polymerase sigma-70 factor, ECF subfamily
LKTFHLSQIGFLEYNNERFAPFEQNTLDTVAMTDHADPAAAPLNDSTLRVQQLFVQHQGRLRAFVLSLTPDFSTADDVMQETFLVVSRKASEFQSGSNFLAWARRIATFKAMSVCRDRQRSPIRLADDVLESLAASAPEDNQESQYLSETRALKGCLEKLAPAARELVRLRYFGEHTPEQIGQLRSQSVNSINVTLSRARVLLRECMNHRLNAEESLS